MVATDIAFELDVIRSGARRLGDKVYITDKDDDDKGIGVFDPKKNPDGFKTCKSLEQEDICLGYGSEACKRLESGSEWVLIFIVLGLFYLFIGIAILCDELFVPALEIIADKWELSNDVAGATLMAAGGSAPELATSFVGTFKRSDVGFGTIVGSAVFNVLFVIGCCAMFTPKEFEPLVLTWWPLARDCSYYVLTLGTLVLFMSDKVIEWWEALLQLCLYFGYVLLMKNSSNLEEYIKRNFHKSTVSPDPSSPSASFQEKAAAMESGSGSNDSNSSNPAAGKEKKGDITLDPNADFKRPSTFRAGILTLLTAKTDIMETAGVACVARIKGDVNDVFNELDSNKNGTVDPDELKTLLLKMGSRVEDVSDEAIEAALRAMDQKGSGVVTKDEFVVWYTQSEARIKNQTKEMFGKFDTNQSGTIEAREIKELLRSLGNSPTEADVKCALKDMHSGDGSKEPDTEADVTIEMFTKWYEDSLFWTQQKQAAEQAADACKSMWEGVLEGCGDLAKPSEENPLRAKVAFVLTLPLTLAFCLIPDCRPPGKEHLCYFTFLGSIVFVGLLAIVMVELATIFGDTLGIPTVVMGLTILAAGTSVPDLLSSVIVAKQGEGDMAVSSSIGSNIFDVAVGLPVPWLVFSIVASFNDCNCGVIVGADNLFELLLVLLGMVAAIILTIKSFNWEMTKSLGYVSVQSQSRQPSLQIDVTVLTMALR